MKKEFRVAVFLGPKHISQMYRTMVLAFGKNNVQRSMIPEELFGILKQLRPTTVIMEPELFANSNIQAKDILAYQSRMHYRIIAVYPTEESMEFQYYAKELNPVKEYLPPVDHLTICREIPSLCTNKYVSVKKPLETWTQNNIMRILRECGFHCNAKGASLLAEALCMMYFDEDLHRLGGLKKIYTTLSEKYGYTPRIVERSMLRFIESSWTPETERKLREELKIYGRPMTPLNFSNFTEIFNTYYSQKYGYPRDILSFPRKNLPDFL